MGILTKRVTVSLIIGIVIFVRIFSLQLPSFKIDMTDWQAWAGRMVELGPTHFYSPDYFADYFPGYLYILWGIGIVYKLIYPAANFFSENFAIILKFITTLFDMATAFIIFRIVSNYQKKSWGILASIFYLANPALIFNSSVWGQIDGILTFFSVLAFYYLLEMKSSVQGSLSLATALLIKPQALAAFPIFFTRLIKTSKPKSFVIVILILAALPLLISWPFFLDNPIFGLFQLLKKTAAGYQYTSLYAFNFWSIIGWWQSDSKLWLFIPYQVWGLILYLLAQVLIIIPLIKKPDHKLFYFAVALSLFAFFLFPTRVHERYLFPFFAFSIVSIFIYQNKLLLINYMLLSILHFVNLWYVYFYYNTIYGNSNYQGNFLFNLIDQNYKVFAILTILSFIFLIFVYYKVRNHDPFSKT